MSHVQWHRTRVKYIKLEQGVCKKKKSTIIYFNPVLINHGSIPVADRSKAWVCSRSLAGIAGSNPAPGHGSVSVVSVVCCQVEVSAMSRSLDQRSPTDCGVPLCVIENPQE